MNIKSKNVNLKEMLNMGFLIGIYTEYVSSISNLDVFLKDLNVKEKIKCMLSEKIFHPLYPRFNSDLLSIYKDDQEMLVKYSNVIFGQLTDKIQEEEGFTQETKNGYFKDLFKSKNIKKLEKNIHDAKKIGLKEIKNNLGMSVSKINPEIKITIPDIYEKLINIKEFYVSSSNHVDFGLFKYIVRKIGVSIIEKNNALMFNYTVVSNKNPKKAIDLFILFDEYKNNYKLTDGCSNHKLFFSLDDARSNQLAIIEKYKQKINNDMLEIME